MKSSRKVVVYNRYINQSLIKNYCRVYAELPLHILSRRSLLLGILSSPVVFVIIFLVLTLVVYFESAPSNL